MTSALTSNVVANNRYMKSFTVEITDFDNETETFYVEARNESDAAQQAQALFGGDVYMMNVYSY
ncbi:MAG: hypothetical protein Q4E41_03890 [Bacteroidales bacterium]|nr:hypothetical protein [Bacteroidales bacterium]